MRPQPIRGYLTLGRGVTIHQADCAGLARMARQKPQRLLEVEWSDAAHSTRLSARVLIDAFDRHRHAVPCAGNIRLVHGG